MTDSAEEHDHVSHGNFFVSFEAKSEFAKDAILSRLNELGETYVFHSTLIYLKTDADVSRVFSCANAAVDPSDKICVIDAGWAYVVGYPRPDIEIINLTWNTFPT